MSPDAEKVLALIKGHRRTVGQVVFAAIRQHGMDADAVRSAVAILVDSGVVRLTPNLYLTPIRMNVV